MTADSTKKIKNRRLILLLLAVVGAVLFFIEVSYEYCCCFAAPMPFASSVLSLVQIRAVVIAIRIVLTYSFGGMEAPTQQTPRTSCSPRTNAPARRAGLHERTLKGGV